MRTYILVGTPSPLYGNVRFSLNPLPLSNFKMTEKFNFDQREEEEDEIDEDAIVMLTKRNLESSETIAIGKRDRF